MSSEPDNTDEACDHCDRPLEPLIVISAEEDDETRFCSWGCHDAWIEHRRMRQDLRKGYDNA